MVSNIITAKRAIYTQSKYKLDRARRLYKHLVAPAIFKNPELIFVLAVRAANAQLWSTNTAITDVVYSLNAGVIKAGFDVYNTPLNGCIWWSFKNYYRKTDKGYVQIKKIRIKLYNKRSD